jgi:hypothetical protein
LTIRGEAKKIKTQEDGLNTLQDVGGIINWLINLQTPQKDGKNEELKK